MSLSVSLPAPTEMIARLVRILPRFAQIHWVPETTSTNTDLIRQARDPGGQLLRPWLLGAHHQTKGQGRGGKQWDNTPGTQLMFSCAFDVFLPSQQLPTLSPAMGIAACQAIRSLLDRKSTRLNSSHVSISYAVFCLKKKRDAIR